jgi:hypothetical protein
MNELMPWEYRQAHQAIELQRQRAVTIARANADVDAAGREQRILNGQVLTHAIISGLDQIEARAASAPPGSDREFVIRRVQRAYLESTERVLRSYLEGRHW